MNILLLFAMIFITFSVQISSNTYLIFFFYIGCRVRVRSNMFSVN
jgi:hypothetical protein